MTAAGAGLTGLGGAEGNCPGLLGLAWPASCQAGVWRRPTLTRSAPAVFPPATPSACSLNSGHSPSAPFACPAVSASSYPSLKTPAPVPLLGTAISDRLRRGSAALWVSAALPPSLSGPALTTWEPRCHRPL